MRAGRLVALLILLQDHGKLTARELARHLEVSERTVMRDIEALSGVGVPVFATRGAHGGFQLLGPYGRDLPLPVRQARSLTGRIVRARVLLSPKGRRLVTLTGRPVGVRIRSRAPVNGAADRAGSADGWVEASWPIESVDAAVLDVLALGDDVEALRPVELRDAVADVAGRIARRHLDRQRG